jgi:RNA polymerase sigma-70 factor, ECF subfamily
MAAAGLISSVWKRNSNTLSEDRDLVSDERLVATAKSGDAGAFDQLFKRHTQKIFRVTYRITRNHEDAEDAVQECFLNAFIHLRSFDGRSRFSTWLTRIAMNAALMKVRKNRTRREVPSEEFVATNKLRPQHRLADPAPNPEERHGKSEQAAILRDAIANLRPTIRKAVEIQLQDRSLDEIAEHLGLPLTAVKGRLFQARAALRQRSQLHFALPAIWTNSESCSHAVSWVFRQGARRRQQESRYSALQAGMQAKRVSLKEVQL